VLDGNVSSSEPEHLVTAHQAGVHFSRLKGAGNDEDGESLANPTQGCNEGGAQ
jgi:hypothetical protein